MTTTNENPNNTESAIDDDTSFNSFNGDSSFDDDVYPCWARTSPLSREYFDHEWGQALYEERELYELIALLGFQAGLNWSMVLNKRERLRECFHNFEPDAVATFTDDDVERLLKDKTMIRNKRKISAAVTNARATVELREHGGLSAFVWAHDPNSAYACETVTDLIGRTPEISELATELKKRGFTQLGPRLIAALMQAIGMVPAVRTQSNAA
ncbi:MAG: DNA-3-methyladenine glycosylase I [Corynebacterium casei]|uniref:DNA-3-methyladenine glycosylase I n=1 Tax=Corynebacterium casei TaxID=160386 RepID=UPI003F9070C9